MAFDRIKSMLWESDDKPAPAAPTQAAPPGAAVPSAPGGAPGRPQAMGAQLFGVDPEMVAQLKAVVTKRQTPYTALMDAAKLLEAFIPDEPTRFKAAFAQVSANGQRTSASLVPAIELHLTDLDSEARAFGAMLQQQVADKVESNVRQAAQAREQAQALRQRAEQLQQQATEALSQAQAAETQALDADGKAGQAKAEIDGVQQRFTQAVEAVKTDLSAKKTYLSTIL